MIIRLIAIVLTVLATATASAKPRPTLETVVNGRTLRGAPLSWTKTEVHLLGPDGRLWSFPPSSARGTRKISDGFRGLSAAEMRSRLAREFGKAYDVSGTGHYLVVHPAGQRDYWAARFEELYRSFVHYFSVRGFHVRRPEFPLVAIVVPRRADLERYAAAEGIPVNNGVLGYYSQRSNRVILYDQGESKASKAHWAENNETIIHEATHQTAFNTGVHSRLAGTPRWVAEGLGTMFESPGVWNSRFHRRRNDRINRPQLELFQKQIVRQLDGNELSSFVAGDGLFRSSPAATYSMSWSLTFYLVETQPKKYAAYLKRTAARRPGTPYTARDRLADFTAVFGKDFRMINARFVRFMAGLK